MAIAINGAGTITGVSAGGLPDGCIQAADIASGVIPAGGKCLQVVQTVITAITSSTTTTWADISGFAVTTGTLASSSSKLLIWVDMLIGSRTSYTRQVRMKVTPSGGSAAYPYIGVGNTTSAFGAGSAGTGENVTMYMGYNSSSTDDSQAAQENATYLYSASSTVAHTIQMEWIQESGNTSYLNRSYNGNYGNGLGSLIVMEIGA